MNPKLVLEYRPLDLWMDPKLCRDCERPIPKRWNLCNECRQKIADKLMPKWSEGKPEFYK